VLIVPGLTDKNSKNLQTVFKLVNMSFLTFLKLFDLLCFFGYGFSCLFSNKMKAEFVRFGLAQYRSLTGILQVAGGTGLIAGFYYEPLTPLSSLGLALLMFLGVGVRIKIHDPVITIIPAFVFMGLNFLIFTLSMHWLDY